jgi:hypothetical protein
MDAFLVLSLGIGRLETQGGIGDSFRCRNHSTLEPFVHLTTCICQLPLGTEKPSHVWVSSVPHQQNYNTLSIPLLEKYRTGSNQVLTQFSGTFEAWTVGQKYVASAIFVSKFFPLQTGPASVKQSGPSAV